MWDFAGDGFVHRLIHNKADGKLVEISDPEQTSEERPQVPAQLSDVQVRVCSCIQAVADDSCVSNRSNEQTV